MVTTPIILGISPGTRFVGIAILCGSDLIDFRIKSFKGKWNSNKASLIAEYIEKIISRFNIQAVALKESIPTSSVSELEAVISKIKEVIKNSRIEFHSFSMAELKMNLFKGKWKNKMKLLELLSITFPEITHEYHKERNRPTGYYYKLAEAIAVALNVSK